MDSPPDLSAALARVDALHAELDAMRPLESDAVGRAMQRLRLEWTYHSNAIEGNSLTYGETVALLMHGVTAQGKPLKDHLDIRGHRAAIDTLEALVQNNEPLTLATIRELHKLLLGEPHEMWAETADGQPTRRMITPGEFKTQPNHVLTQTGEPHFYARPDEVEPRMQALIEDIRASGERVADGELNPVVFAAEVHHRFVAIHPFDDGNGRMGRLLMNLMLMRDGYLPAVVRQERRPAYYGALSAADAGDGAPIIAFIADELAETMELYVRALKGEPDPTFSQKRIALLKRVADTSSGAGQLLDRRERARMGKQLVLPLIEAVGRLSEELAPLFGSQNNVMFVTDEAGKSQFKQKAISALTSGDWVSFRPHWQLEGLKVRPQFSVSVALEGRAGSNSLVVKCHPGEEYSYAAGSPLPESETIRVAEAIASVLLDRIEQAMLLAS